MPAFKFATSSYSGGNAGQECVEVARNISGVIAVRDSKLRDGAVVQVAPETWSTFVRWSLAPKDSVDLIREIAEGMQA